MSFCWPGYDPHGYSDSMTLISQMRSELEGVRGARICEIYSAWNVEDERWCAEAPLVLELEDRQLEVGFTVNCLMSLTINEVNLLAAMDAEAAAGHAAEPTGYAWRTGRSETAPFVGRFIVGADLLERCEGERRLAGIELATDKGVLEIVNVGRAPNVEIAVGGEPEAGGPQAFRRVMLL